jgi:hypothetical protein
LSGGIAQLGLARAGGRPEQHGDPTCLGQQRAQQRELPAQRLVDQQRVAPDRAR